MKKREKLYCPFCGSDRFIRKIIEIDEIEIYDEGDAIIDNWIENIENDYVELKCKNCGKNVIDEELVKEGGEK